MVHRLALLAALLSSSAAFAQDIPNHSVPVGGGPGAVGWKSVGPCPSGQVLGWNSPTADPVCTVGGSGGGGGVSSVNGITGPISFVAGTNMTIVPGSPNAQSITLNSTGGGGGGGDPCLTLNLTGDVHSTNSCLTTLATVNGTTGTYGTASAVPTITVNAKGLITNVTPTAITLPFTSMTGTLGCAQMPVLSGDVTSAGGTCATTIANGVVTNAKLVPAPAATLRGNPTNAIASVQDFKFTDLPNKSVPAPSTDSMLIFDSAAGTLKYCLLNQCITGGGTAGVSSLNTLTGALNLSAAAGITITPSGSNIQIGLQPVTNPTQQVFNSGSGTYTTPAGVVRIEVHMVGAGGGGAGGGAGAGTGTAGTASAFGGFTAPGGLNAGGAPPAITGCTFGVRGGWGQGGLLSFAGQFSGPGGPGAASFFGGGGAGGYNATGTAAVAPGAGGGGGNSDSTATSLGGTGGSSGAYCFQNIRSGLAASYAYSVGVGGNGGAATAPNLPGGAGANGLILVREYYSQSGGGGGGGTAGVTSLNTLLGDLNIVAGTGISVSQAGSTITVANTAAVSAVFTTGDIKPTMKTVADTGWVMMNVDGSSIGDAASSATVRAAADCQALFQLLWNNCSQCPVSGGRGGDSLTDWNAHKAITLPYIAGRTMAGAGTQTLSPGGGPRVLGAYAGLETLSGLTGSATVSGSHTITVDEMPQHTHATDWANPWELIFYYSGGGGPYLNFTTAPGNGDTSYSGGPGSSSKIVGYTGSSAAFSMSSTGSISLNAIPQFEPKNYFNFMIKL